MKAAVNITLLFFLFFLVMPTVVSALEEDSDFSFAYNISEEDNESVLQAVNISLHNNAIALFAKVNKTLKINSYNLRRHISVCGDIFIPPPEPA
ncbi:hypothetical protein [Flavobacterium sp.]|uniref:hypothetical protein n=1 Tax=Flavobacterium sp. TaxID=239 RepID=UPI00261504A8|nr:hypothetical protein [Flavobacterium sp.]